MMPETLTLQQANELVSSCKSDFNPFGTTSFEGLLEDANKRKHEHSLNKLNLKDVENVRLQKK